MKKQDNFYIVFLCGFFFLIFRNWFLNPQIIGGDWPFIFEETFKNYSFYFSAWNPFVGNGLGGVTPIYSLGVFHGLTVFLSQSLSLPWTFVYKVFWFGLFIGLSVSSSMYLLKVVIERAKVWQYVLASVIFSTNTYILMVVSGGQMGVALAYSMTPLVLARYIKLIDNRGVIGENIRQAIIAGLALAIQVMFDPRIAYLALICVGIYGVFSFFLYTSSFKKFLRLFFSNIVFGCGFSFVCALLLHAVWVVPLFFVRSLSASQESINVEGFRFFSFADFSHALSLLHPNWPENIFGKTYFLKSEFLLLPILAYSSLIFITRKNFKAISSFCLLGLVGVFLAKGANFPFGEINIWLFNVFPGMNLFRDSTKFYLLIAISYSILIPYSTWKIYEWLVANKKSKILSFFYIPKIFLLGIIFYLILLTLPALFGHLNGTFKAQDAPGDYIMLKNFLYNQPGFFRTLWIPRQNRFSFYSVSHIPVEAGPLFKKATISEIISELHRPEARQRLADLGVRYVIVPYDPLGEIFIKDRKYDSSKYNEAIEGLSTIPWLKKLDGFGSIVVFDTGVSTDHFFLTKTGKLNYSMRNLSEYSVSLDVDGPQYLVFAENYNPYWVLKINNSIVNSKQAKGGINSFYLNRIGKYTGQVIFLPDRYYFFGTLISGITLLAVVLYIFYFKRRKILPNQ